MNKVTDMIARHEGHKIDENGRHIVYKDSLGYETVGYGRLLSRGLSGSEALFLLENDVADHRDELIMHAPWVQSLDEVRQSVLIDMAFNLGVPALMKFERTLRLVRNGAYADASREMLRSKWAEQVKARALELSEMMKTGLWGV